MWKMGDIIIPVRDRDNAIISKRAYVNLLEPGTVVKVNDRHYFYSCPLGVMNLEGVWTDEESNSYSVREFLCKVIDDEATVELVLEG